MPICSTDDGPGGWVILDEPELILDPIAKTLEVYRREGSLWIVASTHG